MSTTFFTDRAARLSHIAFGSDARLLARFRRPPDCRMMRAMTRWTTWGTDRGQESANEDTNRDQRG